jgi:hypothetical protein
MSKARAGKNDRHDPWGFFPSDRGRMQPCFECGKQTVGRHHVVPVALGGTKVLPLCHEHHKAVHGFEMAHPDSIRAGLERARARGVILGAPRKLTKVGEAEARKMRANGWPYRAIAEALGVSVGSAHKAVNRK